MLTIIPQVVARTTKRAISAPFWLSLLLCFCLIAPSFVAPRANAQDLSDNARYAAIVVDAQTGEVMYARRADAQRYPASLTKIMTLYMAFEAISYGRLKLDDTITISAHAAAQPPSKIGFRPGDTISVDMAMKLIALYSANDLAVALAEKIGGSEERFAALMTIRAHDLGMAQSNFANASGLPDSRQLSTAQDMAILARVTLRDYPQYYSYFNTRTVEYRGRTYYSHNPLLDMPGVDGMKTGYTNAAGYNLVASQVKNGHRLIAVMLGGNNKAQRREHVSFLLNTGFDIYGRRDRGEVITVAQNEFMQAMTPVFTTPTEAIPYTQYASNAPASMNLAANDDPELKAALRASKGQYAPEAITLSQQVKAPDVVSALTKPAVKPDTKPDVKPETKTVADATTKATAPAKSTKVAAKDTKKKKDPTAVWSIQVGAFKDKSLAQSWLGDVRKRFGSKVGDATASVSKNGDGWYRSRFADMTKDQAQNACKAIESKRIDCMVIKPDA